MVHAARKYTALFVLNKGILFSFYLATFLKFWVYHFQIQTGISQQEMTIVKDYLLISSECYPVSQLQIDPIDFWPMQHRIFVLRSTDFIPKMT